MQADEIEILNILMTKFTADESGKIVTYVSRKNTERMDDLRQIFLTKEDKVELVTSIESVKSELSTRIESIRSELGTRIESVRSELGTRIESVRSELISRIETVDYNANSRIDNLKIDLMTRMDSHFRWLVGLLFTVIAIMVALIKL